MYMSMSAFAMLEFVYIVIFSFLKFKSQICYDKTFSKY